MPNCDIKKEILDRYKKERFHYKEDGEVICFSKTSGDFVRFYNGRENGREDNFKNVLKEIIRNMRSDDIFTPERKAEILAKLREMRANGEL